LGINVVNVLQAFEG